MCVKTYSLAYFCYFLPCCLCANPTRQSSSSSTIYIFKPLCLSFFLYDNILFMLYNQAQTSFPCVSPLDRSFSIPCPTLCSQVELISEFIFSTCYRMDMALHLEWTRSLQFYPLLKEGNNQDLFMRLGEWSY